jgi:outer membrane biosynthesis protein TonB
MNNNFVDGIARSLVQHAAHQAPASLAQRLEEEWLADFEERSSGLARLRFGIGCCWATRVIAHEFLEPKVAAASAAGGTVATTGYTPPDYSFLSRRTVAVLGILALHAVIIYGFATGLVHTVMTKLAPPVTMYPTHPKTPEQPPPLVPREPTFDRQIVKVERVVDVGPLDSDNAPRDVTVTEQPQTPPIQQTVMPPAAVNRVAGGPGRNFPNTEDYYPPDTIRQGVMGSSTVRVCTDDRGRLTGDPALVQTSGTAALDRAALKLARAGSGHYRASTEDGRAVSSCYPFRVTFTIRK